MQEALNNQRIYNASLYFAQTEFQLLLKAGDSDEAYKIKKQFLQLTEPQKIEITEEEQKEHLEKYKGLNPVEFLNKLRGANE